MEATEIIRKIQSAVKLEDVIDINNDIDDEYKSLMIKIHPDKCNLPLAPDAASKLSQLRDEYKNGKKYIDDSGEFITNGYVVTFSGDPVLLKVSLFNYNLLCKKASDHLKRYLPKEMKMKDDKLIVTLHNRNVSISHRQFPQEHTNWILSRLLEFSALLHNCGYQHCGLNPESVMVTPENHGIQIISFYHLTPTRSKVQTISAKYKNWYPNQLFSNKIAKENIDLELSKRIAAYCLGDASGLGLKLKKTHNKAFIDFINRHDTDSYQSFNDYRELLKKNFETKFHNLNV